MAKGNEKRESHPLNTKLRRWTATVRKNVGEIKRKERKKNTRQRKRKDGGKRE